MEVVICFLGCITLIIFGIIALAWLLGTLSRAAELLFESHEEGNLNPFFRLMGFEVVPAYYKQRAESVAGEAQEVLEVIQQHRRECRLLHSHSYNCEDLLERYLKLLKETVFEQGESKNEKPRGA